MPLSIPILKGSDVVRVFESLGLQVARQNGSHIIKEGEIVTLSIPDHREVAKGTLRKLIRMAGLTIAEFVAAV
jgi:predicted RNA binding protein YcfA (HicA-like mRNA interferase family)